MISYLSVRSELELSDSEWGRLTRGQRQETSQRSIWLATVKTDRQRQPASFSESVAYIDIAGSKTQADTYVDVLSSTRFHPALPGVVALAVPVWVARRNHIIFSRPHNLESMAFVLGGLALLVVGALLFASSLFYFWTRGRGTLAPWDRPRVTFVAQSLLRLLDVAAKADGSERHQA